jgi:hypothetical protein
MKLSGQFLVDVGGVNAFLEVPFLEVSEGDSATIYLQLRDISIRPLTQNGYTGRRYIPATGASLRVYIDNSLDSPKMVTKVASQPFVGDASIWTFSVYGTDALSGTKNIRLELTEGATITRGLIQGGLRVASVTSGY